LHRSPHPAIFWKYGPNKGNPTLPHSTHTQAFLRVFFFLVFMSRLLTPPEGLRFWLEAVVDGTISSGDVRRLVEFCHAMATIAVRHRFAPAIVEKRTGMETSSDVAIDCIADLFRRDDQGHLVQIRAYFESIPREGTSDQELLAHLSRLIFAKVNQGIYRILNEVDPGLGKILRNTKLAIQSLQQFSIVERFGELSIAPASLDSLEHLPQFDRAALHAALSRVSNGSENIPTLLAKLALHLRQQVDHSRLVPLMTVSLAIRDVYKGTEAVVIESHTMDDPFAEQDIILLIKECCKEVRREMEEKYVERKKLPADVFDTYFSVIHDSLLRKYLGSDGYPASLYELLRQRLPGVTHDSYNEDHRARLEYLARLADTRAATRFKNSR
jgi:hypothetical protein